MRVGNVLLPTRTEYFDHGNIIKYCHRPFVTEEERRLIALVDAGQMNTRDVRISRESIEQMNTIMIENINAVCGRDDILWHGGDAFLGRDFKRARELRDRINCQTINLIFGNHDNKAFRPLFNEIYDQILINVEGQSIFLNHYPLRSWPESFDDGWMLYGHVHQGLSEEDAAGSRLTLDIGVDGHYFRPWTMAEIRQWMEPILARKRANKLKTL